MNRYPVTCKVDGKPISGFPCWMTQVDVDLAIEQDNVFPVGAVVKVFALGGVIHAYKDAEQTRLTRGAQP